MSGHSKWNNIKRKKKRAPTPRRQKIFARIGKEIVIAVRDGGANPDTNNRLRDVIAKAKANNVPNDNINRMLQKASGAGAENLIAMTYEGYGPGGVAVIVETLTDNKTAPRAMCAIISTNTAGTWARPAVCRGSSRRRALSSSTARSSMRTRL